MEKQITIIIPTYNMEAYIGKCLDSLIIPDFDNVEVLVVNDGSKDHSSDIAHSYASQYPNSIRVIDKPNGNYGSCINAALPQATGRYIKVLDSDDTFDTSAFSAMVEALPGIDADVVMTPFVEVDEDGVELHVNDKSLDKYGLPYGVKMTFTDAPESFSQKYVDMHHIAYSIKVFDRLQYQQTEGISYTDTEWSAIILSYCKTFYFLNHIVYRYLVGRDGQTMSETQLTKNFGALTSVLRNLILYLKSAGDGCDKKRLYNYIEARQLLIYGLAFGTKDQGALDQLHKYDSWVKVFLPSLYAALDEVDWKPTVHYKVFRHLRARNFSAKYQVPWLRKKELSVKARLKQIIKW